MSKVILLTGASSGIGKATALRLIRDGHTVYGAARRVDKMQDLVAAGGHALSLDVTDEASIQAAVQAVLDAEGRIDVLINNAGYAVYGSVEEVPLDDARRQFEVNLFGLARITQLVLPGMRAQKSGTIVNISSIGGKIYTPLGAWYHATKHAVEGFSDVLRLEVAPFGIDVVIIEPGAILTEFGDVMSAPMLERSGDGPYADLAATMAEATAKTYTPERSSPPSVVAAAIAKAVVARRPKTRYAMGKMSGTTLFLRRWLPDRWFDKAILQFG